MKFGQEDYKTKEDCKPCTLDYDCILRGDNVIVYTKQEIYKTCNGCSNKDGCVEMLRQAKSDLYAKKYNDGTPNS